MSKVKKSRLLSSQNKYQDQRETNFIVRLSIVKSFENSFSRMQSYLMHLLSRRERLVDNWTLEGFRQSRRPQEALLSQASSLSFERSINSMSPSPVRRYIDRKNALAKSCQSGAQDPHLTATGLQVYIACHRLVQNILYRRSIGLVSNLLTPHTFDKLSPPT